MLWGYMIDFSSRDATCNCQLRWSIWPFEDDGIVLWLLLDDLFHEGGGKDNLWGAVWHRNHIGFLTLEVNMILLVKWRRFVKWLMLFLPLEVVFHHQISDDNILFELRDGSDYAWTNLQMICRHWGHMGTNSYLLSCYFNSFKWLIAWRCIQTWQKLCPQTRVTGLSKTSWQSIHINILQSGLNILLCSYSISTYYKLIIIISYLPLKYI